MAMSVPVLGWDGAELVFASPLINEEIPSSNTRKTYAHLNTISYRYSPSVLNDKITRNYYQIKVHLIVKLPGEWW